MLVRGGKPVRLRHIRRLREIARVLTRYGLGPYVRELGLPPSRVTPEDAHGRWPERLRAALAELGPTFIKLGQLAAARPDLIPAEYAAALQSLRDEVPPVPAERIRQEVAAALGAPLESVFAAFDPEPLAAASIGQVHAARLHDGTDVLVKVRRPGIAAAVQADLELLAGLAARVEQRFPAARDWQLSALLEEFRRHLLRELDLGRELRQMTLFARVFAGTPEIRVPRPYPRFSSERLLVMERLPGEAVGRARPDPGRGPVLAERLVRFFLDQVFDCGFFHADLHPGNVLILPGDALGILDFGQVGWLDEDMRWAIAGLLTAFVERDYRALADGLLAVSASPAGRPETDPAELRRDLMEIAELHDPRRLSELALQPLLVDLLDVVRRHRLRLPRSLALLFKAAASVEGTVRVLDPDFDFARFGAEYARVLARRQLQPRRLIRLGRRGAREVEVLLREAPARVRSILRRMDEGAFNVEVKHAGLQPVMDRLSRVGGRLSASLVMAALIVGASLIVQSSRGPMLLDIPVLAWIGYGAAVGVALWLLWTARQERRGP